MGFVGRGFWLRLLACTALAAALGVTAAILWWRTPDEDIDALRRGPPPRAWAALQRQEDRWREDGTARRVESRYVPLSGIAPNLQLAMLVGEDIDFFGHGPVDVDAVWEAVQEAGKEGGRLRGASTISQQLAKTLFLSGERTLWRKVREARLAWWLERRLGKRRILELYLNVVEFGPGLFGVEVAARHYFDTTAAAVTDEQAAGLAAAVPSPGRDNPATGSRKWQFRRATILRRMEHAKWLRTRLLSESAKPRD